MLQDLKLSIITVVRNGANSIEGTIKSILAQTYKNIEYIIIDGKSTDGTLAIIEQYQHQLAYWVSEPDRGIYDAMNKGIRVATGDWLLFINSDDFLTENTIIQQVVPYLINCESEVAYGKVEFIYSSGKEVSYGLDWKIIKDKFINISMRIPHQATFHSKALFIKEQYDISYKVLGDYDLLLGYLKTQDAIFIPLTIAKMYEGGISNQISKYTLLKETRKAQIKHKIYKYIPSIEWFAYGAKLILVNAVIRIFGTVGKDKIKYIKKYISF
ncbi:glycosyltransferase family 2 protein [Dyadobacter pollutisoli]|uniref:Glycosyltransferase family 2 protein n=1 Tax=Dyadobacter pollutisoli TaxID=2910158 RepID=A0A9E8N9P1_9BACT|nr:glycosyltransferase family 2 protein [Dyadobacter pollutisoli]WAC11918.1 glycosyltransferase family 2 protein [Dyadobacter pollutisoli]